MPQIREYPQADSPQTTDAFVIDRIGSGTEYIEWGDLLAQALQGSMIYATLPSGTTDQWAPTGWIAGVDAIVITSNGAGSALAGLTGGAADRRVILANTSTGPLTLTHDASATPADSFYLPGSTSLSVAVNGAILLVYDETAARWRAVYPASPGASTAVAFRAETPGDFDGTMTSFDNPNPQFSNVLFDTAGGMSQATMPGIYSSQGPTSHYIIQQDGIYSFHVQIFLTVSSGQSVASPIFIDLDVEWMNASGNTVLYSFVSEGTGGLAKYSPATEGMNQFTIELSFTANCTAGQFLWASIVDKTNSMWHNLAIGANFNCCFEGYKIA